MIELIRDLHDRYSLSILSNASDRLERTLDDIQIAHFFDVVVNSYRIGLAKPDEKAFLEALAQLQVEPEEVYFIDDQERNTSAAAALGITSHIFEGIESLRAKLARLSLLV